MATGERFRLEVSFGDASFAAEGAVKQVMDAYAEFRNDVIGQGAMPKTSTNDAKGNEGTSKQDGAKEKVRTGERVPLPVFLKEHPPKTNDQTVAVLAAWASEQDGASEVTTKRIEELWGKSGRKKPANIHRDIGKAVTQGWLDDAGRGKYTVPTYGANYVHGLKPESQ